MFLTVLDDIFTPERCAAFIGHFSEHRRDSTQIDNGMAKYRRVVMIDPVLAAEIFAKVRHLVPPEMHVVSANDHIRMSEYVEGEEFKMHIDGINQDGQGHRSVVTVNVFLNGGDFQGGSTDFFHMDRSLRRSVKPAAGRAAIFDSQQYHCGRPVTGGRKYLLRTDLMA